MKNYKFVYNNKEYELGVANFSYMLNDEEYPVAGINREKIIELLNQQDIDGFDIEYYDEPCSNCLNGTKEKSRYFKFLEYHFFIYTKKGTFVTSSISKENEGSSLNALLKKGIVDKSYIVSIIVCVECGEYAIEIEQCEA